MVPDLLDEAGATPAETKQPEVEQDPTSAASPAADAPVSPGDEQGGKQLAAAGKAESEDQADSESGDLLDEHLEGLELPEDAPLHDTYLDETTAFAQEAGLSLEQARALVQRDVQRAEQELADWDAKKEAWKKEARSHPDIGGVKLPAAMKHAQAFLTANASPDFVKELRQSGFINHPELLAMCAKGGAVLSEPSRQAAGSQPAATDDVLASRYPSLYAEPADSE